MLALSIRVLLRARNSASWPTIDATVVEARVKESKKGTFQPIIRYEYFAGGEQQSSRRISGGLPISVSGNWAQRTVDEFRLGSRVHAYVDPRNPGYAVLRPGIRPVHVVLVVFSALAMTVPVAVTLLTAGSVPA